MKDYLFARLSEWSTWAGGATALSAFGIAVSDDKVQAAFTLATFLLGVLTAGSKEKGSEK